MSRRDMIEMAMSKGKYAPDKAATPSPYFSQQDDMDTSNQSRDNYREEYEREENRHSGHSDFPSTTHERDRPTQYLQSSTGQIKFSMPHTERSPPGGAVRANEIFSSQRFLETITGENSTLWGSKSEPNHQISQFQFHDDGVVPRVENTQPTEDQGSHCATNVPIGVSRHDLLRVLPHNNDQRPILDQNSTLSNDRTDYPSHDDIQESPIRMGNEPFAKDTSYAKCDTIENFDTLGDEGENYNFIMDGRQVVWVPKNVCYFYKDTLRPVPEDALRDFENRIGQRVSDLRSRLIDRLSPANRTDNNSTETISSIVQSPSSEPSNPQQQRSPSARAQSPDTLSPHWKDQIQQLLEENYRMKTQQQKMAEEMAQMKDRYRGHNRTLEGVRHDQTFLEHRLRTFNRDDKEILANYAELKNNMENLKRRWEQVNVRFGAMEDGWNKHTLALPELKKYYEQLKGSVKLEMNYRRQLGTEFSHFKTQVFKRFDDLRNVPRESSDGDMNEDHFGEVNRNQELDYPHEMPTQNHGNQVQAQNTQMATENMAIMDMANSREAHVDTGPTPTEQTPSTASLPNLTAQSVKMNRQKGSYQGSSVTKDNIRKTRLALAQCELREFIRTKLFREEIKCILDYESRAIGAANPVRAPPAAKKRMELDECTKMIMTYRARFEKWCNTLLGLNNPFKLKTYEQKLPTLISFHNTAPDGSNRQWVPDLEHFLPECLEILKKAFQTELEVENQDGNESESHPVTRGAHAEGSNKRRRLDDTAGNLAGNEELMKKRPDSDKNALATSTEPKNAPRLQELGKEVTASSSNVNPVSTHLDDMLRSSSSYGVQNYPQIIKEASTKGIQRSNETVHSGCTDLEVDARWNSLSPPLKRIIMEFPLRISPFLGELIPSTRMKIPKVADVPEAPKAPKEEGAPREGDTTNRVVIELDSQ